MKLIVAFFMAILFTVPVSAGTLTPVVPDDPNQAITVWIVDYIEDALLLLEKEEVESSVGLGSDFVTKLTGAYARYDGFSWGIVPVYGSCVLVPPGWNIVTQEIEQCTIHGAGANATILYIDEDRNATWTFEGE